MSDVCNRVLTALWARADAPGVLVRRETGGSNLEGELGTSRNAGTSNYNWIPSSILGFNVTGSGYEVVDMSPGAAHVFALSTLDGKSHREEPRRTLVWGSNAKGQIGEPWETLSAPVAPRRLFRSMFPRSQNGNRIVASNRRVCYFKWNDNISPGWNDSMKEILLPLGVLGLQDIESAINNQMGGDYIRLTTDADSELVNVHLVKAGVQFDFMSSNCTGLADHLGFSRPFFKLPPTTGLFKEVAKHDIHSFPLPPFHFVRVLHVCSSTLDCSTLDARPPHF